jgi:hypothetical protein
MSHQPKIDHRTGICLSRPIITRYGNATYELPAQISSNPRLLPQNLTKLTPNPPLIEMIPDPPTENNQTMTQPVPTQSSSRPLRLLLAAMVIYASWLTMMAVHESGHALAAILSGGHVQRVVLPLLGFSRTDVDPNPSPRLEIWAGPVWGMVVPLCLWLGAGQFWRKARSATGDGSIGPHSGPYECGHVALSFFVGLCLIANGAYLAFGWTMTAGDAAELVKRGTPIWLLIAVGLPSLLGGFYIWHTIGSFTQLLSARR